MRILVLTAALALAAAIAAPMLVLPVPAKPLIIIAEPR